MSQDRNIDFLYEVGALRLIERAWRQFTNANFQNITEHTYRVIWIALILSKSEKCDVLKIMKLALIHDLSESRTGDTDYLSRMYTERNEAKAMHDILKDTCLEEEFSGLFEELHERKTIESQIVKDADNLDVDFELSEQISEGKQFIEEWLKIRDEVYKKLYTNAAKKMWQEIYHSNPHNWHLNAPNRFTAGDWQIEEKK